jgi:hypothetical protein
MLRAEEILDELHQIREEILDEYEGQPDEVYLRDLHARNAKVCEELGLKPAEPTSESSRPSGTVPEAKEG